MKKIIPFFLFLPLIIFSLYLGFTQSKNPAKNKNPEVSLLLPTDVPRIPRIPKDVQFVTPTPTIVVPSQINLLISSPISGAEVDSTSISVTGTTEKNVSVIVNDQELISNTDGTFKTTVLLDEGENYISIVAYDDLGNSAEREIMVTRTVSGL